MNNQLLSNFIAKSTLVNKGVFSVLLRNGMELVSRVQEREVRYSGDPEFTLVKPLMVRVQGIPVQSPQGIAVQTAANPTQITFVMHEDQFPLYAEDVWHITECPKKALDMYLQATTGIQLA